MQKHAWLYLVLISLVVAFVSPSLSNSFYNGAWDYTPYDLRIPLNFAMMLGTTVGIGFAILLGAGIRRHFQGATFFIGTWIIAAAITGLVTTGMMIIVDMTETSNAMIAGKEVFALSASQIWALGLTSASSLWQHATVGLVVTLLSLAYRKITRDNVFYPGFRHMAISVAQGLSR